MKVYVQVMKRTGKPVKQIKILFTMQLIKLLESYQPFYINKQNKKLYIKVYEE